jgi:exosortase/archaeosortase family protein
VGLFRDTVYKVGDHVIRYDNGVGTSIIWGCTGLKQSFIFMCLILTVLPYKTLNHKSEIINSLWLHKLWFIPLGWLCCYAFNIARIAAITLLIEFHPDWFSFLHDYLFKYLFYAMLFGLWVIFVEKIRPRVLSH